TSPHNPLHAFGVDDIESISRLSSLNTILNLDHFCKAVVDYSCRAPKKIGAEGAIRQAWRQ
ncbi:MAG: hypothetical protein LAP85_27440, partial [Acidobacteriia bacterium]|nr:hypothetical protein [Terriglobia bacterium]